MKNFLKILTSQPANHPSNQQSKSQNNQSINLNKIYQKKAKKNKTASEKKNKFN